MALLFDTIVAPITGSGGAVAVVRVSGPSAWAVAGQVFPSWPVAPEPLRAVYGLYMHGDDGIALPFAHGHSYTGEDAVELSCHGSRAAVRALVDACLAAGARLAEPGEFTQRAFLHGRVDLSQAEGVRDTIEAQTAAQLRLANLMREGSLRREVDRLRSEVIAIMATVEASVDFSEEVGELDRSACIGHLQDAERSVEALLETAHLGQVLRSGLRVAIVGPPNAGKSSLLNALLGSDRSIVTDIPGTTRDYLEEQMEVDGFPVVLIDTAGLRDSTDAVESLGIQRSRAIAANADLIWYVYDSSAGWKASDDAAIEAFGRERLQIVANKSDLATPTIGVAVSATLGRGLAGLVETLPLIEDLAAREIAINSRHAELLTETVEALRTASATLATDVPYDLVTVCLRQAIVSLGRITGETATPDMVDVIFSSFCIGK